MANCTHIKLKTVDQQLTVMQQPVLASGDVGTVQVEYVLDSYWDGYAPSGIFFTDKNPKEIFEQPLTDGICVIPWEVLKDDGALFIGLRGVTSTGLVKTASPVRYRIDKGSPRGNGTTVEPTPDVYQQMLNSYVAATKEFDKLSEAIADETTAREQGIALLTTRMNNFTTLPEGSTTGDAELADIRVGADSTIYSTAGEAVRRQVSKLSEAIADYESVLKEYKDSGIEPQTGFYNLQMQFNANTNYKYIAAPVASGEMLQVTGAMPAVARLAVCIFADDGGNTVGSFKDASAEAEAIADEDVCTVPDGAVMVYVNSKYSAGISLKKYVVLNVKERLENAENSIKEINAETESIRNDVSHAVNKVDEITESIPGTNILPPDSVNGYLDNGDGVTLISSTSCRCSTQKIPFNKSVIYIMVNPLCEIPGTGVIALALYNADGEYINTISTKITASGTLFARNIDTNTAMICVWTNSHLELANVCISAEEFDTFAPYELRTILKQETINLDPIEQKIEQKIIQKNQPFYGKTIVNFGDSIFGNKRPPNDVSTALANCTGATVYNCGFGGCRMAKHNENWDAFSMYRLAYAIANNDFTIQDAVDVSSVSGMPAYFNEARTLLKSIDWNTVDIITIAYGTNDFTGGRTLDDAENLYNTDTFGGALRYSIETILCAYPHLKVFVCGQTYRFWMDDSNVFTEDSDTKTLSNGTLLDFVEKTAEVSKEYKLPFIDNYYELGINKYNRGYYFPENDGTHHNVLGAKLMAEHIASELF